MEKEVSARVALVYQKNEMEKVVEESKKLKLEVEENSKLQEFLVDRGRDVRLICYKDVTLLKEKFDMQIPLSRSLSLSSSQTSSILASSTSSFRSAVTPSEPEPEPEPETYGTPKMSSEVANSYGFLEKSSRSGLSVSPKSLKETIYSVDSFPSGEEKHDEDED